MKSSGHRLTLPSQLQLISRKKRIPYQQQFRPKYKTASISSLNFFSSLMLADVLNRFYHLNQAKVPYFKKISIEPWLFVRSRSLWWEWRRRWWTWTWILLGKACWGALDQGEGFFEIQEPAQTSTMMLLWCPEKLTFFGQFAFNSRFGWLDSEDFHVNWNNFVLCNRL